MGTKFSLVHTNLMNLFMTIIINFRLFLKKILGTFLGVQRLRFRTSTAGGVGLIPGQGTKILHAMQCGQKKEKKEKENSGLPSDVDLTCVTFNSVSINGLNQDLFTLIKMTRMERETMSSPGLGNLANQLSHSR